MRDKPWTGDFYFPQPHPPEPREGFFRVNLGSLLLGCPKRDERVLGGAGRVRGLERTERREQGVPKGFGEKVGDTFSGFRVDLEADLERMIAHEAFGGPDYHRSHFNVTRGDGAVDDFSHPLAPDADLDHVCPPGQKVSISQDYHQ